MRRIVQSPAASTPPAVTVEVIRDPTTAGSGIEGLDLDAVQLQATPFRARRVTVRLPRLTVVFHAAGVALRTHTSVRAGQVAYVAYGPKARGTLDGVAVRPGLLLAAGENAEARLVVEAGWQSVNLLLPPQDLVTHLRARQPGAEIRPPQGLELLQVEPQRVQALFRWGHRLAQAAAARPALFDAGERERAAAEVEGVETLLAALRGAGDLQPSRSDRSRQTQGRIVQRAEDYALAHAGEPIYVTDLCRAAAASERSLEVAFKANLGLTPMAYLLRLRLHRARSSLQAARRNGGATVSAIALDWGFWHFGDFSRAYKACFGEAPSQTLHGRRGLPRSAEPQTRSDGQ
jgi:AraC-like DNA-binding protein